MVGGGGVQLIFFRVEAGGGEVVELCCFLCPLWTQCEELSGKDSATQQRRIEFFVRSAVRGV